MSVVSPFDPPQDPQRQAEQQRERADHQQQRWRRVAPPRFHGATVETLDGPVAALAASWDTRSNVVLLGGLGVGKTHAAVAMARQVFLADRHVVFYPVPQLVFDLSPEGPKGAIHRALGCDLLVLDDLGASRGTAWVTEQLYHVVNHRWMHERPIIATANTSAAKGPSLVGARIWSRLTHGAVVLELAGPDRRREKGG